MKGHNARIKAKINELHVLLWTFSGAGEHEGGSALHDREILLRVGKKGRIDPGGDVCTRLVEEEGEECGGIAGWANYFGCET